MSASHDPLDLSRGDWTAWLASRGEPAYRAGQIFEALHGRSQRDYSGMTVLPRALRETLQRELPVAPPEIVRRSVSSDGSRKLGIRLADGALVEAVFMPGEGGRAQANEFEDARAGASASAPDPPHEASRPAVPDASHYTVCLSSQTGCAVDCAFCVTGRLGGGRNLTRGEILGQLYSVQDDVGRGADGLRVVFMGMGEPFLNPDGVIGSLETLFETVSPRRVTVSTSGITPAFERFARLPRRPNLAVSINAADEETRSRIMPISRTYPLAGVVEAMKRWPLEPRRRITAEYVLIADVNDSVDDARRLAKLLRGISVKVNLIPLNEDPVYLPEWKRPPEARIDAFAEAVAAAGLTVTVRRSRGPDASAACGQLKGRTVDRRKAFARR